MSLYCRLTSMISPTGGHFIRLLQEVRGGFGMSGKSFRHREE